MDQWIKQMRSRKEARQGGFTLIELLVVIIILGILAAVVVFAVSGTGDKGRLAAGITDAKTLRTAQEAFCAQNGSYATEDELLAGGFLSEGSSMHDIVVTAGGPCGNESYAIACDPAEPSCGQAGTVPDGNFPGGESASPTGLWTRTADLPEGARLGDAVTMPNGKVLFFGGRPGSGGGLAPLASAQPNLAPLTFVYDPTSSSWTRTPPMRPGVYDPGIPDGPRALVLLEGTSSECGTLCGKVFVKSFDAADENGNVPAGSLTTNRVHFFIFDPVAFDAGANPWTPVFDPHLAPGGGFIGHRDSNDLIQIRCARAPGNDCGKVLLPGAGLSGNVTVVDADQIRVALFDPTQDPTTAAAWQFGPNHAPGTGGFGVMESVGLGDGRVLSYNPSRSRIYDPFSHTWSVHATPNLPNANIADFQYTCPGGIPSSTQRHTSRGRPILLPGPTPKVLSTGSGTQCKFVNENSSGWNSLLFDPSTNTWQSGAGRGLCLCHASHTPVLLPPSRGSKVLVVTFRTTAADSTDARSHGQVESVLYDPATSTWTPVATQFGPRFPGFSDGNFSVVATVLQSGQVLMAGGMSQDGSSPLADTWIYTPPLLRL